MDNEEKKAFLLAIGGRIKALRKARGYSQEELSRLCGYNSRSTINKIEMGINDIPQSKLQKIADVLHVSPTYLLGSDDESIDTSKITAVRIPVLGDVAAGLPISAIEDILDWEEITEQLASTGEFFGLRIHGDSMAPRICDGDVVIVRQQSDAESGDIVIVRIDHDQATCKRLRKYADGALELISFNPSYEPRFYDRQAVEDLPVEVIGVVVELRGKL